MYAFSCAWRPSNVFNLSSYWLIAVLVSAVIGQFIIALVLLLPHSIETVSIYIVTAVIFRSKILFSVIDRN